MLLSPLKRLIREGREEETAPVRRDRWASYGIVAITGAFSVFVALQTTQGGFDPKITPPMAIPFAIYLACIWGIGGFAFVSSRRPGTRFRWSLILVAAASLLWLIVQKCADIPLQTRHVTPILIGSTAVIGLGLIWSLYNWLKRLHRDADRPASNQDKPPLDTKKEP